MLYIYLTVAVGGGQWAEVRDGSRARWQRAKTRLSRSISRSAPGTWPSLFKLPDTVMLN